MKDIICSVIRSNNSYYAEDIRKKTVSILVRYFFYTFEKIISGIIL